MNLLSLFLLAQGPEVLWTEEDRGPNFSGAALGIEVSCLEDLNGDEIPEFAIGLETDDPRVYDGASLGIIGTLRPSPAWSTSAGWGRRLLAMGDLNGDGVADIAVSAGDAAVESAGDFRGAVRVFSGATFYPIWGVEGSIDDGRLGNEIERIADVNQDGVDDLVVSVAEGLHCLSGIDGSLIWDRFPGLGPNYGAELCAIADIDGDGAGDLVVYPTKSSTPGVEVLSGSDGQLLMHWRPTVAQSWQEFGKRMANAGDQDGDGFDEIVVQGTNGGPRVVLIDTATGQARFDAMLPSGATNSEMEVTGVDPVASERNLIYYTAWPSFQFEYLSLDQGVVRDTLPIYLDSDVKIAAGLDSWRDGFPEILVGVPDEVSDRGIVHLIGARAAELEVSELSAGSPAWLRVRGLPPGERVVFFASLQGPGPTFASNAWFLLSPPIKRLGPAMANSQGVARKDFILPPQSLGVRLWFQAAIAGATDVSPTTALTRVVSP